MASTPPSEPIKFTTAPPEQELSPPSSPSTSALSRAGLDPYPRVILIASLGSLWGFLAGSYLGGRQSSLQYLAENAHRLPRTVKGWYFYHKTKNYKVMLGGIQKGARFAVGTGSLCLAYGLLEAGIDRARGEADVANSVASGLVMGTVFAALTRLSRQSVRYSVAFGATCGLMTGGLNDLHSYLQGQPPSYLRWTMRGVASSGETAETARSVQGEQDIAAAAAMPARS